MAGSRPWGGWVQSEDVQLSEVRSPYPCGLLLLTSCIHWLVALDTSNISGCLGAIPGLDGDWYFLNSSAAIRKGGGADAAAAAKVDVHHVGYER